MTGTAAGLTEVNWALGKSGASVVSSSYEAARVSGEASNLLSSREDQLWLTGDPPQSVTLKLHPTHPELRYAGWHVWRDYLTNPKTVEIASGETIEKLSPLLVCEALPGGGTQVWRLPWPIPASHAYVRFTILSTFGAGPTYMNNLVLLATDPGPGMPSNLTTRESPAQAVLQATTTTTNTPPAHLMTSSAAAASPGGAVGGASFVPAHSYTPPAARRDAATAPLLTTSATTAAAPGHDVRAMLSTLQQTEPTTSIGVNNSSAARPVPLSLQQQQQQQQQQDRLLSLPAALNAATPRNQPTSSNLGSATNHVFPNTNNTMSHTAGCTTQMPESGPQTNLESGTTVASSRMNRLLKDLDNDIRLLKPIKSVSPHRNMLAYVPHELPPAPDLVLDAEGDEQDEEEGDAVARRNRKNARPPPSHQRRRKSDAAPQTPQPTVSVPLAELQAAAPHELHSVQETVRHTSERLALLEQAVAALTQTMQHQREDLTMIKRVLLQQATERRRAVYMNTPPPPPPLQPPSQYHQQQQQQQTSAAAAAAMTMMTPAPDSPQALVVANASKTSNAVAAVAASPSEEGEALAKRREEAQKERSALHALRSSLEHRLTHHQIDVDFPENALRGYVESVLEQRLARQLRRAEAKTLKRLETQLQSIVTDLSTTVEQRVRSQLAHEGARRSSSSHDRRHQHSHHPHSRHSDDDDDDGTNDEGEEEYEARSAAKARAAQRHKERGSRHHHYHHYDDEQHCTSASRQSTSSPRAHELSGRREHGATPQPPHKHSKRSA